MRTVPPRGAVPLHRLHSGDKQVTYVDVRSIMEILPHRYPFLLIDRITELDPQKRGAGYKNVTMNEWFFAGHFPNNPVMPGVLIIEAMAQLGGAVVLEPGSLSTTVPYLAGVDKVKFRRPVVPGDKLMMECSVMWIRMNIGRLHAEARVDEALVCSAELAFSIVSDTRLFRLDASVLHL